jgi:hypothetical protein
MRKFSYLIFTCFTIFLTGCFETTLELTLNEDGSGILSSTNDMSNIFSMMGQMGGGNQMDKLKDMDSTIRLSGLVDSVKDLTAEEKALIRKGTMKIVLKQKDEKFFTVLSFPFQKISDVKILQQALPKMTEEATKKIANGKAELPMGMNEDEMPKAKTFDDFFDIVMTNNSISKTINKEKYATAADDQYMKILQQMGSMGAPATVNYVFNLPRPATKMEGKGLKLSSDKKKVTLTVTSDDFFDEPKKFEFKIEY